MTIPNMPNCPICNKSDKVEPVEKVVFEAFSTTPDEGTEPIVWANNTYYLPDPKVDGFSYHMPARRLLPVLGEPTIRPKLVFNFGIVSSIFLIIGVIAFIFGITSSNILAVVIGTVILTLILPRLIWPLVFLFTTAVEVDKKNRNKHLQRISRIEIAEAKWKNSYYCYRNVIIFDESGTFANVFDIVSFLFDA
jgi:hypothetical protein